MEKENKFIIITKELHKKQRIKTFDLCCNYSRLREKIKKNHMKKIKEILIYDKTFLKKQPNNKKIYVNDHVNKTGKNPLLKNYKNFLDISYLYTKHKDGIITTCLGKNYKESKHQYAYPSTTLCLFSIWCKNKQPEIKITGVLINVL